MNLSINPTRRTAATKTVRETEAEAIAFVIGKPSASKWPEFGFVHPALPRKYSASHRKP